MKIQSIVKKQAGIAHLAIIAVLVVSLGIGAAGFAVYKNKGSGDGKLKADAAGAYSSLCGGGYNLKHTQSGPGFKLYNYKNSAGRGCALVVNDNWGTSATMSVTATAQLNEFRRSVVASDGPKSYKYYAGPIYYAHGKNIDLSGTKNGKSAYWGIRTD